MIHATTNEGGLIMKFQKLVIHNIASIEDAVIDFEAQPLAGSEVFLITGKTGAGKSTILDAICLALFANTPRLFNTEMQGDTKDGDKTVTIKDPRQLMRRNTGEAFVSLTFIGSNGVHYEAIWSVARANKKPDRALQNKKWQLRNLDTDFTLTKDAEIKSEIQAAIGLDFNQFCRTTMLAQGEFTRFLNSKDEEKAEILEKITGVNVYSKIGAKVYEVTGQKKDIWDAAQQRVAGVRTLEDVEIAEKLETLSSLDNQYKELKKERERNVAKCDWQNRDSELAKERNGAAEALDAAKNVVGSEDFIQKEQTVKDWNATIDARLWMNEVERASYNQKEHERALEELASTYSKLLGGLKYAENEIGKMAAEIGEIETFISSEADRAGAYENAQTIVGHLNTISEGRNIIKKNQEDIEAEKRKLTDLLKPNYEKAHQEAQQAKEKLANEEEHVKAQEKKVAALNLPELRKKRDAVKELLGKIATAQERIETLTLAKSQREDTRKGLAERKEALDEKRKRASAMEDLIHDAKIKMEVRKEALSKQSDTVDKFASALRSKLQIGDTCPVCRQKIESALPLETELAALVAPLQEAYEKAETAYRNLAENKVKLEAEIATESKAYGRDKKAFEEDRSVANAEQKVLDACKACGIEKLGDNIQTTLEGLNESKVGKFGEIAEDISEGEKQELGVKELRKELDAKRAGVEELKEQVRKAEGDLADSNGKIKTSEELVKMKSDEIGKAEQQAAALIVGNWQIDWKESPKKFASAITFAATKYNTEVQKKQKLASQLKIEENNTKSVKGVLDAALSAMDSWRDVEAGNAIKEDNLLAKANELNTSVAAVLAKLKTAEESLKDNQKKLDDFLAEHEELSMKRLETLNAYTSDDIRHKDNLLKNAREEVIAKKTLFDTAEKLISEHRAKKPELAENDTPEALAERIEDIDGKLGKLGEQKGAINQDLKTDKENKELLGTLKEDADKKKADYEKWSRMNQLIGDATGKKFRMIAQSYVLTSLIHSANSYMKSLTDRYTLKVTPGTFVITLEDAYQGFVSRAASTISGGESFLVSLSLALALSDIGQTLSVDTLFIDEGFGTLSGEPLQNAINTLRTLHTKEGRHVGIISHVEELRERISVQIQVNQEGNNSSSKIKIVPENESFS